MCRVVKASAMCVSVPLTPQLRFSGPGGQELTLCRGLYLLVLQGVSGPGLGSEDKL